MQYFGAARFLHSNAIDAYRDLDFFDFQVRTGLGLLDLLRELQSTYRILDRVDPLCLIHGRTAEKLSKKYPKIK